VHFLGYAAQTCGPGWRLVGQDGGQSIPLHDGGSLFLFSDTLLAPTDAASQRGWFLGNCAAIAPSSPASTLGSAMTRLEYFADTACRPREILEPTVLERAAGYRFWPEHGLDIGGKVTFFYIGIRQYDPRGTWGFEEAGAGLAVFDPVTGHCHRILNGNDWRPWPNLPSECHCGVQLLPVDSTVYVFCSRVDGLCNNAYLARVHQAHLERPDAYEFFGGRGGWAGNPEQAEPIATCGSEYSVAFNAWLGCYLMVYVDAHGKQLCLRTAPNPWGAWSDVLSAGVVPHSEAARLVSIGFHHPQFDLDGGRTIFVSYSQPHFTQNALIEIRFA
jgi:Domain of unknown function (DUF4185)